MEMENDLIVCDVDTAGATQKNGTDIRSKIISYLFDQCPDSLYQAQCLRLNAYFLETNCVLQAFLDFIKMV
jgi:hypothetical protein